MPAAWREGEAVSTRMMRRAACAKDLFASMQRNEAPGSIRLTGKKVLLPQRILIQYLEFAYAAGSQFEIERMRAELNKP